MFIFFISKYGKNIFPYIMVGLACPPNSQLQDTFRGGKDAEMIGMKYTVLYISEQYDRHVDTAEKQEDGLILKQFDFLP
jgi:hypothetical protein